MIRRLFRRLRTVLAGVASRIRQHIFSLLLASAAAGLAYLLAGALFGPQEAVFAPVAAVVATGLTAGQRHRRAVEITVGVVLGIIAADLLTRWLGAGPWQLSLAVLLAMSAAVAFRASGLLSNQAAVAAVVVMILVPLLDSSPWIRLGDALVGGVVAIVLTAFLAPDPLRSADIAVKRVLDGYARVLRELEDGVAAGSLTEVEAALDRMEHLGGARQDLSDALAAVGESIRLARRDVRIERRRRVHALRLLDARIGLLMTSGRSLCRAGANVIRHGARVNRALIASLEELRDAVLVVGEWTRGECSTESLQSAAVEAAATASSAYRGATPADSVFIGQVRSAVVDILRISGLDQQRAVSLLEKQAGRADHSPSG